MFGLIGHSTSFEDAKRKASLLGFDHIADGDLDGLMRKGSERRLENMLGDFWKSFNKLLSSK